MKPTLPKGTRDFGPAEVLKRQYIFDTMKSVFQKYGFSPIETPSMEALETLTGKYGEEGDKLLFKILNNGDFLQKADQSALDKRDSYAAVSSLSKRGLRYDLTVPFARFVVMNQNEISFPFKRYQIQPVWRADRPQKGRYQEFYQCDVDVVGSDSLVYEAELVNIYAEVFGKLGLKTKILVNNRKILNGIAEQAGIGDQFVEMTVALDKLDKIGEEGVRKELSNKSISNGAIDTIFSLIQSTNLDDLEMSFSDTEIGRHGIQELKDFHSYVDINPVAELVFDVTLARGLGYYTGCIFEVKVDTDKHPSISMGSIGGGGRYDDLTGTFGLKSVSGVGVSFGAERIYDVMEELDLFPQDLPLQPAILFVSFDKKGHLKCFDYVQQLRESGVAADIYPDFGNMKKQMKYANARNIKHVAIIGDEELKAGKVSLKNLDTSEQTLLDVSQIANKVQ